MLEIVSFKSQCHTEVSKTIHKDGIDHGQGQDTIIFRTQNPGENGDRVLVSCSSLEKDLRKTLKGNKVERAFQIGQLLGQRAKEQNLLEVAFDRSGYKYHGRVKALAEGARESGLIF